MNIENQNDQLIISPIVQKILRFQFIYLLIKIKKVEKKFSLIHKSKKFDNETY